MLSCSEALERILARSIRVGSERVALASGYNRVLAEALFSESPIPSTDRSAMDGYAVRSSDFIGDAPAHWRVSGESRTGHVAPVARARTACRIFTGAVVPPGFDCVVMQEDTERDGDEIVISVPPRPWQNIRRQGEDLAATCVALEAGTRMLPQQLAVAAALDRTELVVSKRPRVTILCTGDELRPAGSAGPIHSIPDSNSILLSELAAQAGAEVHLAARGKDEEALVARALMDCARVSDVVLTVGGASVGDHDVVQQALITAGGQVDFWKVRIKPGKPLLFGSLGSALVLGLPGNPVSAWITLALFGIPLLRSMQGERRIVPHRIVRHLAAPIHRKPGRQAYLLATLDAEGVRPLPSQSSGSVIALGKTETLIELAETRAEVLAGEWVDTIDVCSI